MCKEVLWTLGEVRHRLRNPILEFPKLSFSSPHLLVMLLMQEGHDCSMSYWGMLSVRELFSGSMEVRYSTIFVRGASPAFFTGHRQHFLKHGGRKSWRIMSFWDKPLCILHVSLTIVPSRFPFRCSSFKSWLLALIGTLWSLIYQQKYNFQLLLFPTFAGTEKLFSDTHLKPTQSTR